MRSTIITPNTWAADVYRFQNAKVGRIGCHVVAIEHAVARLAGGFKQPINRTEALDAVREVLETGCPPHFESARNFPGLVRAVTATLMKVWAADLDLEKCGAGSPQIEALCVIEQAVLTKFPPSMQRHGTLKAAALARLEHAQKVLGDVIIVGRTEMSPVWRDFIDALSSVVAVTWDAGPRSVPQWLKIPVVKSAATAAPRRYVSCADAAHEVLEALRWARGLIAGGKVKPEEIAICAAAPQAYDGAMSALSADSVLPVHFIHGRRAAETWDGQEVAALADVFLNGLSLQAFRRLASLAQGEAFKALPEGWKAVLPREASLTSPERWKSYLDQVKEWPGGISFAEKLMTIVAALAGEPETAAGVGRAMLGRRALAIWERALLEGPAEALITSIQNLATPDGTEGLTSIAWGSAAAIASVPRHYVWMLGLNAGSWPRGISEDPLLPAHLIDQVLLDPLPVVDADRRDFDTLLKTVAKEIVISRSRRDIEGRELGISPLWPLDEKVEELVKSAAPGCPISEADRLAGRIFEFKETPQGAAAGRTWRSWHQPEITAHDGMVRPGHPLVKAALGRPMSASTIKLILTDPIGWMFQEVLGLEEPEIEGEPFTLSALDFGKLVHAIIEFAMIDFATQGRKPGLAGATEPEIRTVIERSATVVSQDFEIEVPVPPRRLWAATVSRAMEMAALALLPGLLKTLEGQQSWAEIPFGKVGLPAVEGMPWDTSKPVTIAGVPVSGKVDRLDLAKDGKRARVVDWKTGRIPGDAEAWVIKGGEEVQRAIYASAAFQLLGVPEVEAGLAYLKGGAAGFVPLRDAAAALTLIETRLTAMRAAAEAGFLLPGPAAGSEYNPTAFALPGDAKERYLNEKALVTRAALGEAAAVWEDA